MDIIRLTFLTLAFLVINCSKSYICQDTRLVLFALDNKMVEASLPTTKHTLKFRSNELDSGFECTKEQFDSAKHRKNIVRHSLRINELTDYQLEVLDTNIVGIDSVKLIPDKTSFLFWVNKKKSGNTKIKMFNDSVEYLADIFVDNDTLGGLLKYKDNRNP